MHLRGSLAVLVANARCDAIDQKDAFRAYHINLVMLTYCYQVRDEWCIDLRDPFGNVMSEYTYATIVSTQMGI